MSSNLDHASKIHHAPEMPNFYLFETNQALIHCSDIGGVAAPAIAGGVGAAIGLAGG